MTEAHTTSRGTTSFRIQMESPEGAYLWVRSGGQALSRRVWTSCVGAATAKPRLDVVLRKRRSTPESSPDRAIWPQPEITTPLGGLGDETRPHLPYPTQFRRRG